MTDIEIAKKELLKRSYGDNMLGDICHTVFRYIEELEERIAIMQEPVEREYYPDAHTWECQGCGYAVNGIDKYCPNCGRKFLEEEGEDNG